MPLRRVDGSLVTRIGMAYDAHAWVGGQYAFQPFSRSGCPIRDDDLARVLAVADPNPTTVMERNPGCTTHGVDKRI